MVTQVSVISTAPSCYRTMDIHMNLQFQHGLGQWAMDTKVASRGRTDIRDLSRRSNQKRNHSSSWTPCSCSVRGLSHGWAAYLEAESESKLQAGAHHPEGLLCNDTFSRPPQSSLTWVWFFSRSRWSSGVGGDGQLTHLICRAGMLFLLL